MSPIARAARQTFKALSVRNYRLYFFGQVAMGTGAVIGGPMIAHRSRQSTAMLSVIGLAFGVMLLVVAAAPTEIVALVALVFMGLCSNGSPTSATPRVAVMVGGLATLAACAPLTLRYPGGRMSEGPLAVKAEMSHAEPGKVVDFAIPPMINARAGEDHAQLPRAVVPSEAGSRGVTRLGPRA